MKSRCASSHRPRQPWVIRPSADTCVASVNTIPGPPIALAPRFWMCQSSPDPVGRRILAHRRDRDAVRRGDGAEGDRLEEERSGHGGSLAASRTRRLASYDSEHALHPVLGRLRPCRQRRRRLSPAAPGRRGLGHPHRPVQQPPRPWRLDRPGLHRRRDRRPRCRDRAPGRVRHAATPCSPATWATPRSPKRCWTRWPACAPPTRPRSIAATR